MRVWGKEERYHFLIKLVKQSAYVCGGYNLFSLFFFMDVKFVVKMKWILKVILAEWLELVSSKRA